MLCCDPVPEIIDFTEIRELVMECRVRPEHQHMSVLEFTLLSLRDSQYIGFTTELNETLRRMYEICKENNAIAKTSIRNIYAISVGIGNIV